MLPHQIPQKRTDWEEAAKTALAGCHCFHGRNLSVELDGGFLVLRGVVKSEFQKELVYRAVKKAVGLTPLSNEIELIAN